MSGLELQNSPELQAKWELMKRDKRITELEAELERIKPAAQAVVDLKSLPVMSGYRELADQIDAAKDHLAAALKGDE
jgi:hypothetical protein